MGNKLLLADDSITIQKVVGIIFSNEDYELTVVDNGDAALEKAGDILPDIMLVDALMPGKSGYEVCEAIRRDPALKHIPLLLLTGAFEPFDEEKARLNGADDFISKPFESQHLIDKVKNLIEVGKERKSAAVPAEEPISESPLPESVMWDIPAQIDETLDMAAPIEERVEEPAQTMDFPFKEEAVAATPDDDLWGAFELEEVSEDTTGALDIVETYAVEPETEAAEVDTFTFGEDEALGQAVEEPELVSPEVTEAAYNWEPVEEQAFAFQEVDAAEELELPAEQPLTVTPADEAVQLEESPFFADADGTAASFAAETEPPLIATPVAADMEFAFEEQDALAAAAFSVGEVAPPALPVEAEMEFAAEEVQVPIAAAVSTDEAVAPVAPVAVAGAAISEQQLAEIISRISREVIEKIVWEVVPDLAETLIKEEIRKIKEGS